MKTPVRLLSLHYYEYGRERLQNSDKNEVVLSSHYGSVGKESDVPAVWQWIMYKIDSALWVRTLWNGQIVEQRPYDY